MLIVNSSAFVLSCNASQLVIPATTVGSLTVGSVLIGFLDIISQIGPSPCTMIMRLVLAMVTTPSQVIVQTVPATLEDVFVTVNVTVPDITTSSLYTGFYNGTEAAMLSKVVSVSSAPVHDLKAVTDIALFTLPDFKIGYQTGPLSITTSQVSFRVTRASFLPITVGAYLLRSENDPSVSAGLIATIAVDVGFEAVFKNIQGDISIPFFEHPLGEIVFDLAGVPFSVDFAFKAALKVSVKGKFEEGLTLGAELTGLPSITVGVACGPLGGCQPIGSGEPNLNLQPSFSLKGFCEAEVSVGLVPAFEVTFNIGPKSAYELLEGFSKAIGRDFRADIGEIFKAELSVTGAVEASAKAPDSECGCVNNKEQASITIQGSSEVEAEVSLGGRYFTAGSATYKLGPALKFPLPKLCSQNLALLQCELQTCGSTLPPSTEVTSKIHHTNSYTVDSTDAFLMAISRIRCKYCRAVACNDLGRSSHWSQDGWLVLQAWDFLPGE